MKYPIGIQSFENIRKGGYAYVDKTRHVYELASTGSYYFLSRPRRFGKSLLLSTLEAYFEGRRDLFEGLDIMGLERDWERYPVLYIDLNTGDYSQEDALYDNLNNLLSGWERIYGSSPTETGPSLRFGGIIERAHVLTGKKVVILVDEYDKPLIETLDDGALHERNRKALRSFYSNLKTQDKHIRFAFLTGVTKFGKVSVFSDLNNLEDLTMNARHSAICGISENELLANFRDQIGDLATANQMTYCQACERLKLKYDGYHFAWPSDGVYNPFSLLNALKGRSFDNYWFETATPTILVTLLKEGDCMIEELQPSTATAHTLKNVGEMGTPSSLLPILYQSGYLTLAGHDPVCDEYTLRYPNQEVEQGVTQFLALHLSRMGGIGAKFSIGNFVKDVREGNPQRFMERLQAFFYDGDYRIAGKMEKYFQNSMYIMFKLLGFYTDVERATSKGRIDIVIRTRGYVYVMELKVDESADVALAQIDSKDYRLPFAVDDRKLFKIGVSFSSRDRSIVDWKIA